MSLLPRSGRYAGMALPTVRRSPSMRDDVADRGANLFQVGRVDAHNAATRILGVCLNYPEPEALFLSRRASINLAVWYPVRRPFRGPIAFLTCHRPPLIPFRLQPLLAT